MSYYRTSGLRPPTILHHVLKLKGPEDGFKMEETVYINVYTGHMHVFIYTDHVKREADRSFAGLVRHFMSYTSVQRNTKGFTMSQKHIQWSLHFKTIFSARKRGPKFCMFGMVLQGIFIVELSIPCHQ